MHPVRPFIHSFIHSFIFWVRVPRIRERKGKKGEKKKKKINLSYMESNTWICRY